MRCLEQEYFELTGFIQRAQQRKYKEVIFKEKRFFSVSVTTVKQPQYATIPVIILSAYLILS